MVQVFQNKIKICLSNTSLVVAQELELKDYEIAAFDQKKEYRDQAQAMLDAWANAHYKKATRRRLIKAMKDEGLEKAAAGVFSSNFIVIDVWS